MIVKVRMKGGDLDGDRGRILPKYTASFLGPLPIQMISLIVGDKVILPLMSHIDWGYRNPLSPVGLLAHRFDEGFCLGVRIVPCTIGCSHLRHKIVVEMLVIASCR